MIFDVLNKKVGLNKTIALNLCGSVILQGITFITLPIFSRILGSSQFGYYSVFMSWEGIFSVLLALGINTSIGAGVYYYANEYKSFRSNILFFNIIVAFFSVLIYLLLYSKINVLLDYNFNIYVALFIVSFSVNVIGSFTSVLIFEKKALLNFILSVFLSISNVILSLIFIVYFPRENLYESRVYGYLVSYFTATIIIIICYFAKNRFRIDTKYLKYGIYFGLPVVFHQLSHYVLGQSDRIMMQKMSVLDSEIGIYSLFYTFCGVIRILLNAFNTSFGPYYADYINANDKDSMVSKSKNYIELFTIICIGFLMLSREVSYIMADEEFYGGINLIPIITISAYFTFLYQFAVNYEFFYRRTKIIASGTIGAAIVNIILNVVFIRKFGMYGAAYSTLISYGLLFIFHFIIANNMKEKRFYIGLEHFAFGMFLIIIATCLFYLLANYVILRWVIGALLGLFEIYRIYRRKSIF